MALSSAKKALYVVAESTWSTAPTNRSSYARVPAEAIAVTPSYAHLARPTQSNSFGHKYTGIAGQKGAQLTFNIPIPALSTQSADGSASAVTVPSWFTAVMKSCGYTETLGRGSDCDDSGGGSSTTSIEITDGHYSRFTAGGAVRIGGECRLVTAASDTSTIDTLTITPALSGAPSATTDVYGGAHYVPVGVNPAASYTYVVEEDGVYYILKGCNGILTIPSVNAGGIVMMSVTISANTWTQDVSALSSGTFPSLTMPTSVTALGSKFLWGSATSRAIASFGFDPKRTIVPQETTEDSDGRSAWVYTDETPAFTAQAYRSTDATDALQTDYATPTTRTVVMALGATTSTGTNVVITSEVAQITAYPAHADANGKVVLPLTIEAKSPSTSGLPTYCITII